MQIGIIGTGYVGLVTAVGLAELGNKVIGTDIAPEKIEKANQGIAHIYEPGLEDLLKKNLKKGNLAFEYDLDKTIQSSDVLFICVSTPQREDGSADMTYVESVSRSIAIHLGQEDHRSLQKGRRRVRCRLESGIFEGRIGDP